MNMIEKKASSNYNLIDIFKYIFALIIMQYHTSICINNYIVNIFVVWIFNKMGVPFFFACTGFFLVRKFEFENGKIKKSPANFKMVLHYEKRIFLLYFSWCIIYGFDRYFQFRDYEGYHFLKDYLYECIFLGCHYHFWYIIGILVAVPILYIELTFLKTQYVIIFNLLLYVIHQLSGTYGVLPFNDKVLYVLGVISRGQWMNIYVALPLITVGVLVYKYMSKVNSIIKILSFILFLTLNVYEVLTLLNAGAWSTFSYLLTTPFLALFTLSMLSDIKLNANKTLCVYLRKTSTIIYCVHPLLSPLYSVVGVHSFIPDILIGAVIVTVPSFLLIWLSQKKYLRFLQYFY